MKKIDDICDYLDRLDDRISSFDFDFSLKCTDFKNKKFNSYYPNRRL